MDTAGFKTWCVIILVIGFLFGIVLFLYGARHSLYAPSTTLEIGSMFAGLAIAVLSAGLLMISSYLEEISNKLSATLNAEEG